MKQSNQIMAKNKVFQSPFLSDQKPTSLRAARDRNHESCLQPWLSQDHLMALQKFYNSEQPKLSLMSSDLIFPKTKILKFANVYF